MRLVHDFDRHSAFGTPVGRAGGAAGVSLAAHALFLLLLFVIVTRPDSSGPAGTREEPLVRPELVWLAVPGPGGGGGGGGDRTPAPAARLQTRGPDALSVPVVTPMSLTPPRDLSEPPPDPPEMALNLPVMRMDAGQISAMGAVGGSLAAPPDSRGSGTEGGAGTGKEGGSGADDGSGLGPGSRGGIGGGDVYSLGADIVPPRAIRVVKPAYTTDAMRLRIQGEVQVRAVVRADGTVTDVHVSRSLDSVYGLDEEALEAARQWRFLPATRFGQPVAVHVIIGVGFSMH